MIYILVLILLLFLSFQYDICGKRNGRNQWYIVVLVIFILIAGLRYRIGTDTLGYIATYYHKTPELTNFFNSDYALGDKFLWRLLMSLFYSINAPFYIVQLVVATFSNVIFFRYFKRHSQYVFACAFFYFIYTYASLNFETMKQTMAIPIFLFGNDFFLKKEWLKGYALYIIAILFHTSFLALIAVPVMLFLRWNKTGLIILILSFVIGYYLQRSFGDTLALIDMLEDEAISEKMEGYIESERYGTGRSLLNFTGKVFPLIIYAIISLRYAHKNVRERRLLELEPFLMLSVIFLVLQSNIFIFYRYVQIFSIYLILFYSQLFVDYIKKCKASRPLSYAIGLCVFIPLFISISFQYTKSYKKFYPYSSIIEKSINKDREKVFREGGRTTRYDEY